MYFDSHISISDVIGLGNLAIASLGVWVAIEALELQEKWSPQKKN